MSASTGDSFGDARGAQPAIPGSYGEAPRGYRMPDGTRLGSVRLQVADLSRSIAYYEQILGMRVLQNDGSRAALGAQGEGKPLVELHERAGARPVPQRGRTGLFHFAILLPDRASLGRFLRHVTESDVHVGTANHLVSESLYLQDPDNLGIEVYADRPRSTWRRVGRELMMATDPLDVRGLEREAGTARWTGLPPGTVIGHMHLHVGDLHAASAFFSEGLGFDRTVWQYPGALFFGAGGYHHHLGVNIWAGVDATPPLAEQAQLLEWTIELPDITTLDAVTKSLVRGGYPAERDGSSGGETTLITHDPWGTHIRLRLPRRARL